MISIKLGLFITYVCVIFLYACMYYYLGTDHIQLKDHTFINSLYFATTIMSTVGFGDIVPISNEGKIVVMTQQFSTIVIAGLFISNWDVKLLT